jgi:hypothetical protein
MAPRNTLAVSEEIIIQALACFIACNRPMDYENFFCFQHFAIYLPAALATQPQTGRVTGPPKREVSREYRAFPAVSEKRFLPRPSDNPGRWYIRQDMSSGFSPAVLPHFAQLPAKRAG